MVKGTSRRVVIVRSPKPEVFDEAIFILRDGAGARGVTADDLLCEALRTAEEYAFAEGFKKVGGCPAHLAAQQDEKACAEHQPSKSGQPNRFPVLLFSHAI